MAPMTRSNALVPRADALENRTGQTSDLRESSWQFVGRGLLREQDMSEGPSSSYGEDLDMRSGLGDSDARGENFERQPNSKAPNDYEDVLHPLREAANRVGREVERFAEALDGYNPLRITDGDEKHDITIQLIEHYHGIAIDARERLRAQHMTARRRIEGRNWREKMKGFKITHDQDEMDVEESEDTEHVISDPGTTLADLQRWEQEAQTWDLLRRLVELRSPAPEPPKPPTSKLLINKYTSGSAIWEHFLESDQLALERKVVLQWLKDTAEESGEDINVLVQDLQHNAERGDIVAHGWLHTKAAIKNQKRLSALGQPIEPSSSKMQTSQLNASKTQPLVSQLDPDSTTRQGRKLEPQDEYFERAIWLGCYEMLRRGRSPSETRDWCMERTEVWRAVSMSGLPDETPEQPGETYDIASSVLWRRMCFALARRGGGDEYERAVYGMLSGDISSVEPVCGSWDDFLFAHYNALLRTQFDNFIQALDPQRTIISATSGLGVFDAVQFHGDPASAGKRLIESLKKDPRTSVETSQPLKMLQGVLLADDFENFIYQQGLALSKLANANTPSNLIPPTKEQPENENINAYISIDDHDSLRVLTHILIAFKALGLSQSSALRQSVIENVIVSYISFLRLAGKEELIPLYCSHLTGTRRYATLSRSLIDVTDNEQRVTQIRLMRELGLDVQQFVKFQSRYLFADYVDKSEGYPAAAGFKLLEDSPDLQDKGKRIRGDFFGDDIEHVDRVDLLFIRSLEWYLLIDGLWSETFTVGTMLYMRFFKHMHLTAARALAFRLPSSEIAKTKTRAIIGQTLDFAGLEGDGYDEELTEVLNGQADDKLLLKKHLLAEAKNYRELEALIETLDHLETVRSIGDIMNEESLPGAQRDWRKHLATRIQPTKISAQPLFEGWLLTSQQEQAEFKLLREAYLPETLLAYITTLHFTGTLLTRDLLMECLDLSTVMAAEGSDLLELFMKTGRMQELVETFALTSKALLVATSAKTRGGSNSKKLKARGWTPELWSVKS